MYTDETKSDGFQTKHTIRGGLDDVLDGVHATFANYHPLGYGTRVTLMHHIGDGGPYEAIVSRQNSCD